MNDDLQDYDPHYDPDHVCSMACVRHSAEDYPPGKSDIASWGSLTHPTRIEKIAVQGTPYYSLAQFCLAYGLGLGTGIALCLIVALAAFASR